RKRLKQADRQTVATHGNGFGAHGKEGVDGSSPSEGFAKSPANRQFLLPHWQTTVTRGHARGLAGVCSMVAPTRPAWLGMRFCACVTPFVLRRNRFGLRLVDGSLSLSL